MKILTRDDTEHDVEYVTRVDAEREIEAWKSNHDNQVALKRIIAARPDLAERAPMVEKLMEEKRQAELLNVAFHMRIRKLERWIRERCPKADILPENDEVTRGEVEARTQQGG